MSKVDRFKQEEIKTFVLPRNEVKVVGTPDPVQSSEIHFPRFQPEEAKSKKDLLRQEEIHIHRRTEVGSKTFNINDLIKKGLFDAAEYFLGRPLTPIERLEGLMSQEELRKYQEAEKKKKTEKDVLDALAKLVDNTKPNGPLPPQSSPSSNRSFSPVNDGEEKEQDDDDDDVENLIWDHNTKREFIKNFGEETFLEQSEKEISEWSQEEVSRWSQSSTVHHQPPSSSPPMSLDELEEEEQKEQEQVGRLREMKDILPEYKLGAKYTIADATKLLKHWREQFREMEPPPRSKVKPILFQAMPMQHRLSCVLRPCA